MATIKAVVDFLKKQGVEVSAEAAAAAGDKFDGQLLVPADQTVSEGQIAVSEKAWEERGEDLVKWKNRAKKAEGERDELKEASDAGDSHNKKLAEKYKAELESVKPLAERFLKTIKSRWEQAAEKIPDNLKKYYTWPQEGEELSDEQIAANVEKLGEHVDLGAVSLKGEKKQEMGSPKSSPTGKPAEKGGDDLSGKPPSEKMLAGYGKPPAQQGS